MRADIALALCVGQNYTIDFNEILGGQKESSFGTYPAQFTPFYNELGNIMGFTAFSSVEFPLQGNYDFTWGEATYTFSVIFETCFDLYENCCRNQVNLKWVNQEGGIQNYIFTGVRTFEILMGEDTRYIGQASQDTGGFDFINVAERFSSRGRCYKGFIVTAPQIPKSHVDALDSLRLSIQAWVVDDDAGDVPIIIEPDDFVKYTTRTKIYEVNIRFKTAIPIAIQ
jgi:hypothetical protein